MDLNMYKLHRARMLDFQVREIMRLLGGMGDMLKMLDNFQLNRMASQYRREIKRQAKSIDFAWSELLNALDPAEREHLEQYGANAADNACLNIRELIFSHCAG